MKKHLKLFFIAVVLNLAGGVAACRSIQIVAAVLLLASAAYFVAYHVKGIKTAIERAKDN